VVIEEKKVKVLLRRNERGTLRERERKKKKKNAGDDKIWDSSSS
jgi:hypothetical protein